MQRRTKIFGAIGSAAVLAAVAVGASAGTGSPTTAVQVPLADPTPAAASGYPGTVATSVDASGADRVRAGTRQALTVDVQVAGDAKPQGAIKIVYTRQGGEYREERTLPYAGSPVTVESSYLSKPGQYTAVVDFTADPNSVWQNSSGSFTFQVVGKGNS